MVGLCREVGKRLLRVSVLERQRNGTTRRSCRIKAGEVEQIRWGTGSESNVRSNLLIRCSNQDLQDEQRYLPREEQGVMWDNVQVS